MEIRKHVWTSINCEEEIDDKASNLIREVHVDEGRSQQRSYVLRGLRLVQERVFLLV